MIVLPLTMHWPANVLAKTFTDSELSEVISYLELVLRGEVEPGFEIENLGIELINGCPAEELRAVQNRIAIAIEYQRRVAA